MHLNFSARWLLGLVLLSGVLACRVTDTLIAQVQPTPTRTATRRPTFTPVPPPTETKPPPSPTLAPPPAPSRTPTARPAPTRTPTRPPAPPPPAQPTTPRFQYSVAEYRCEHSGGSWFKGAVYADRNDPGSGMPDVRVVFGGAGGEVYGGPELTQGGGEFAFTLTADGHGAKIGTFYIWLVDGGGNRISEMAGPININGRPPPDGCWAGWAFFVRNF